MTVFSHFFLFFVCFYSSIDLFEQQQDEMNCSETTKTNQRITEEVLREK